MAAAEAFEWERIITGRAMARWRRHCNGVRPYSALGYRAPTPEAFLPPGRELGANATARRGTGIACGIMYRA